MASWHEVVDPIAKRFELAAMLGQGTHWNATGSDAVAKVIREMARVIDDEIERRGEEAAHLEELKGLVRSI